MKLSREQKVGLGLLGAVITGALLIGTDKGKEALQTITGGGGGDYGVDDWTTAPIDYGGLAEVLNAIKPEGITIQSPIFPQQEKYVNPFTQTPTSSKMTQQELLSSVAYDIGVAKTIASGGYATPYGLPAPKLTPSEVIASVKKDIATAKKIASGGSSSYGGSAPAPAGMPAPGSNR